MIVDLDNIMGQCLKMILLSSSNKTFYLSPDLSQESKILNELPPS